MLRLRLILSLYREMSLLRYKNLQNVFSVKPPAKKILIETDNFYVTYDACALLEGHAEIHTKKHIGCAAEIDAKIYDEFVELKMWLAKLISSQYVFLVMNLCMSL